MLVLGTWVRRSRRGTHRAAGYGVHAEATTQMLRASAKHQRNYGERLQRRITEHSAATEHSSLPGRRRVTLCLAPVVGDSGVWASRVETRLSAALFC